MNGEEIDYNELWQIVLGEIELMVSKATFATWFKNTSIKNIEEGVVTVAVPNSFSKEWLESKFHKTILKIMRSYSDNIRSADYLICQQNNSPKFTFAARQASIAMESAQQLKFKEFQTDRKTNLNPYYTFNSFIVGTFNELAYATARNIVEKPGFLYNPLYIYGGVGLGKTHLLQATGNELKKNDPNLKISYITAINFSDEYIEHVREGTIHIFRKKYKDLDLLIIDDVQFLGGRDKTQEELFHLFNTFQSLNKQAIFSSDCPPKLIPNLEDRLRSRFEGGMMADIFKPDFETRVAILTAKTASSNLNFTKEILGYIAQHITENVRELEGAVNLISAELRIKKDLKEDQVKEILNKNSKAKKNLTPNQIIKKIANFYNVNEKLFLEKTRKKEVVRPRQIAMYILREDYNNSYPDIGRRFGGKDHTTAMHSYEKIVKEIKVNPSLGEEIRMIRVLLLS